jgi:hypothetical protein
MWDEMFGGQSDLVNEEVHVGNGEMAQEEQTERSTGAGHVVRVVLKTEFSF